MPVARTPPRFWDAVAQGPSVRKGDAIPPVPIRGGATDGPDACAEFAGLSGAGQFLHPQFFCRQYLRRCLLGKAARARFCENGARGGSFHG